MGLNIKKHSMKKLLFLSTLIVTLFSSVEACSPPLETPDHLKESDLVFVGEVVQAGKFKSDMSTMGIDLLVLFTIKGEDVSKMRLRTPASSAACGYDSGKTFEPGSYWLMHAKHDGEVYHTTHLSGNQMFEDMGSAVVEAESLLAESFLYATLTETIDEEICDGEKLVNTTSSAVSPYSRSSNRSGVISSIM